jgi:hypothetical protein
MRGGYRSFGSSVAVTWTVFLGLTGKSQALHEALYSPYLLNPHTRMAS